LDNAALLDILKSALPEAVLGSQERFGTLEVTVERAHWAAAVRALRDQAPASFDMLVDLVSVDYSLFPNHGGHRFGLILHLKSLRLGHRLTLKCLLPEDEPQVASLTDLYANANFLEREAFDQMGIRFSGHPNLKRLLNHHEFVGHPLRKDYPLKKRQTLSANESLMDEMDVRLREKGWV